MKEVEEKIFDLARRGCTVKLEILIDSIASCRDGFYIDIIRDGDGRTALMVASESGQAQTVEELVVGLGADIDAKDNNGMLALMWAARNGHTETVIRLAGLKADIDAKDKNGMSALLWASRNGHTETVIRLVKIIVRLIGPEFVINAKDKNGMSVLMWAAQNGHTETVIRLVKIIVRLIGSGFNINAKDNNGMSALMWAARNGHTETVIRLVGLRADIDTKDKNGMSALMYAAQNGHTKTVMRLVGFGANINARDNRGITALMCAAQNGHIKTVVRLVGLGAAVNARDNRGITAVMWAARGGYTEIIIRLVELGADINVVKFGGETILMDAAQSGNDKTMQMLIHRFRADINARSNNGSPLIIFAAENKHPSAALEMLAARPGFNVDERNNHRATALMWASGNGYEATVIRLIQLGADVNARTILGVTALMWAASNGHTQTVATLIAFGADVNARANDGHTVLLWTTSHGHTQTAITLLLTPHYIVTADSITAVRKLIEIETIKGNMKNIKLLIKALGTNINKVGTNGNTLLTSCLWQGNFEVVSLLVKYGADIALPNRWGDSALTYVLKWMKLYPKWSNVYKNYLRIAEMLLSYGACIPSNSGIVSNILNHLDSHVMEIVNKSPSTSKKALIDAYNNVLNLLSICMIGDADSFLVKRKNTLIVELERLSDLMISKIDNPYYYRQFIRILNQYTGQKIINGMYVLHLAAHVGLPTEAINTLCRYAEAKNPIMTLEEIILKLKKLVETASINPVDPCIYFTS